MPTKQLNRTKYQRKNPRPYRTRSEKIGVGIVLLILVGLATLQSVRNIQHNSLEYITSSQSPLGKFLAIKPKPNEISTVGLWDGDYAKIDQIAYSIQYSGDSVRELAQILSKYASTPTEKARIAYTWIAHNINYNVQDYLSKNFSSTTPEQTLQSRIAVCSGYSVLYQALTKAMGLKSVVIEGYAKGIGYGLGDITDVNHAWNAVQINSIWYFVDVTWGAGTIQDNQFVQAFDPFFFGPPPLQFLYTHFPVRDEWQLVTHPKTKSTFELLPELSSEFFKDGLRLVSHFSRAIQVNRTGQVVIEVPATIEVIAKYRQVVDSNSGQTPMEQIAQIHRYGNQVTIQLVPWARVYDLHIFAKRYQNVGAYPEVARYKVVVN